MFDLIFIGLLQAAAGDPAAPVEPVQAQEEQVEAPVDPRDVVRCRTVRPPGARVGGERICTTPREDEELRQETRELRNRIQTATSAPPPPPGMSN